MYNEKIISRIIKLGFFEISKIRIRFMKSEIGDGSFFL